MCKFTDSVLTSDVAPLQFVFLQVDKDRRNWRENLKFRQFLQALISHATMWEKLDIKPSLPNLGRHSAVFIQRVHETFLIFVFAGELTTLIALQIRQNKFTVATVKQIKSERSVLQITGNNNCILMLDDEEDLFYLQGTVAGRTDNFHIQNAHIFFTHTAYLSWKKRHQYVKCLTMTGVIDAISFAYRMGNLRAGLFGTLDIKNGLRLINKQCVDEFIPEWNYPLRRFTDALPQLVAEKFIKTEEPPKEVLLLILPSKFFFLIPSLEEHLISGPHPVDIETDDIIINVMYFKKKSCLLIFCESGKIICLRFENNSKIILAGQAQLPKQVTSIGGYEDDVIYLFWSDQIKLYVSTLDDNNFIRNVKTFDKMRHIVHVLIITSKIVLIAGDGCVYQSRIRFVQKGKIKLSAHELLSKIVQTAKLTEKLTKEAAEKEHILEALDMTNEDVAGDILVSENENAIVIENKSKYVFRKGIWKICLEKKYVITSYLDLKELEKYLVPEVTLADLQELKEYLEPKRSHSELLELEKDLEPGGSITVEYGEKIPKNITLVSDSSGLPIAIGLNWFCTRNMDEVKDFSAEVEGFLAGKPDFLA